MNQCENEEIVDTYLKKFISCLSNQGCRFLRCRDIDVISFWDKLQKKLTYKHKIIDWIK